MRSASSTVRLTFCSTSRTVAPALADLRQRLEDLVDQDAARGRATARPAGAAAARRSAHGRSRAAAARRRRAFPPAAGRSARRIGKRSSTRSSAAPVRARSRCGSSAERQVLGHRERREDVPALHHEGDAASGDVLGAGVRRASRRGRRPRRRRAGRGRRSLRASWTCRRRSGRRDRRSRLPRPRGRGAGRRASSRSERSGHGRGASTSLAPR